MEDITLKKIQVCVLEPDLGAKSFEHFCKGCTRPYPNGASKPTEAYRPHLTTYIQISQIAPVDGTILVSLPMFYAGHRCYMCHQRGRDQKWLPHPFSAK